MCRQEFTKKTAPTRICISCQTYAAMSILCCAEYAVITYDNIFAVATQSFWHLHPEELVVLQTVLYSIPDSSTFAQIPVHLPHTSSDASWYLMIATLTAGDILSEGVSRGAGNVCNDGSSFTTTCYICHERLTHKTEAQAACMHQVSGCSKMVNIISLVASEPRWVLFCCTLDQCYHIGLAL